MGSLCWICAAALLLHAMLALANQSVLNVCMDATHHEADPASRDLHGLCKPWESNGCCSNETAYHSQQSFSKLYNMDYNHCGKMSDKCLELFSMNNCFYECSPNVGPWLVVENSTDRYERFHNLPMCATQCSEWWDACKDDRTCVDNWGFGFNWTATGISECPNDKPCMTFTELFHNATNFCQTVYTDDYIVADANDSLCMVFDFPGTNNPNAEVAERYAKLKGLHVGQEVTTVETTSVPGGAVAIKSQMCSFVVGCFAVMLFLSDLL